MVNPSVTKVESASPCSTDSPEDHSLSPRNGLICASLLAISVLIIYPVANKPFGDDFSYTKTALVFEQTGRIVYNGWATAMLGWLIPWGAAFIKIFGFSFTLLRLAMLPLALAAAYMFHQILRRFGINRRNAVFGTLTLALSPLFLFMTASYMTDLPGLLVILVCLYMCQRAAAARSDRAAILWLCSAALVNVAGGTVRQIAWLGALIMVPSTAWLLRERRGMKAVGVVMWFFSLAGVIACLQWFSKQPYSVPEHILGDSIRIRNLGHLVLELIKTFLCLLLIIFPIAVAWLPTARRLPPQAKRRIAIAIVALALLAVIFYKTGALGRWTEPWLIPFLATTILGTMPLWVRTGISLLVIIPALIWMEQLGAWTRDTSRYTNVRSSSWNQLAWIVGPFSLSYLILLIPRGAFEEIQDRYLLGFAPAAIIVLLKLYQEEVSEKLPAVSLIVIAIVTVFAIGDVHDVFATSRALAATVEMADKSGISSKSIRTMPDAPDIDSLGRDGWTQIEDGGYINDPRIQIPAGAYKPYISDLKPPPPCSTTWFSSYSPAIDPRYFIVSIQKPTCFSATNLPPTRYRTWLPPFHRALYLETLPTTLDK